MNTRLQVEHPVTEMVTGIDLVEEMIRVAAGEKLRARRRPTCGSTAGRSRAASTPRTRPATSCPRPAGSSPTGRRPKGERDGATVRNDTGVVEGGEISIYYDPMIAKLVTHAPTRAEAIEAQARALDAFAIDGIRHNIPFLSALMQHPRWREGRLSTGFIAEEFPDGFKPPQPKGEVALPHGGGRGGRSTTCSTSASARISGQMREPARRRASSASASCMLGARAASTSLVEDVDGGIAGRLRRTARLAGRRRDWRPGEPVWRGTVDGERVAVQVRPILNGVPARPCRRRRPRRASTPAARPSSRR